MVRFCASTANHKYILCFQVLCPQSKPSIYFVVRSCANLKYIVVRFCASTANHKYIVLSVPVTPDQILNTVCCCQVLCIHIKSVTYCVVRSCASTANHKYLNSTKFTEKGKIINIGIHKSIKYFSEVCLLLHSLIEVCGGRFSRCMNKEDMDNMRTLQMELLINMLNMTEVWFSYKQA